MCFTVSSLISTAAHSHLVPTWVIFFTLQIYRFLLHMQTSLYKFNYTKQQKQSVFSISQALSPFCSYTYPWSALSCSEEFCLLSSTWHTLCNSLVLVAGCCWCDHTHKYLLIHVYTQAVMESACCPWLVFSCISIQSCRCWWSPFITTISYNTC